jgi:small neutral amino acid transporter SnatA (MarC family)
LERIKQFLKELRFVRLIFLYFLIEGEISVLLGLGHVSFREAGAIILIRFGSAVERSYREKVEL